MRPPVLWALGVGLLSCAGPRLPYEARLWLMDAEERLQTARERVIEERAALVAAQVAADRARRALDTVGGDTTVSDEVAPVLREEAEAEVSYAEANLALKEQEVQLTEASEDCAKIALEGARAEAEVRAKLEGANPDDVKAHADEAEACYRGIDTQRALVTELLAKRSSARAAVERARSKASSKAPTLRPRPFLE